VVDARTASLSSREVEVARLVAQGLTNDEIAAALVISPRTVHSHVVSAMRKAGARNRAHLAAISVREGLA
jgi:DNA-binding NarL/FixJ family response regulator